MSGTTPAEGGGANSRRRLLPAWKKLAFSVATVSALLALLELALLVGGVAPATGSGDPFVGFSSRIPHFEVKDGGVRRHPARESVMNDVSFPRSKPDGSTRVVCLGGSTTYGRPFWDETSFAGYLREMLPGATGGRAFDVINAGAMSYASYRVTGVMREAARFDPDAFIVLAGHNEFLERRTYPDAHGMSPWVRETSALLAGTRIGTVLQRIVGSNRPAPEGLGDDVSRIAINSVGPEAYRRDDAWQARVVDEFRAALHGMVDIAEQSGATIVFVVPAANVRDFAPFKSEASGALAPAELPRFLERLEEGRAALRQGGDAVTPLREAVDLDPRYAHAWFLLGRALFAAGLEDDARVAFERAVDEDVCALRASSAMSQAVRDVAQQRGIEAVELGDLVAQAGGVGAAAFADHVHPWPATNALLAASLVDALADADVIETASAWDDEAASAAAGRVDARVEVVEHGNELARLTFVLASLDQQIQARSVADRAANLLGGDGEALLRVAEALFGGGDTEAAMAFAARGAATTPTSAGVLARQGALLAAVEQPDRARSVLERALAIDAAQPVALMQLGVLEARAGDLNAAEAHLRSLTEGASVSADAHHNLGLVLLRQGRAAEAETAFSEALRLDPAHEAARTRLDSLRH